MELIYDLVTSPQG